MNKTFLFYLFSILFLLCSCEKEDPVVQTIELDKSEIILKVGEEYQFKVSHFPENAPAPMYGWNVSKMIPVWSPQPIIVAAIDENGKLTALREGEVTVEVYASIGVGANAIDLKSACKVKVEPVSAETIKLNKTQITLLVDQQEQLTYTISPENTTYKDVIWRTTDASVATVSHGIITAKGVGEALITISVSNATVKDTCKVMVNPVKLESFEFEEKEKIVRLEDSFTLKGIFSPVNATNKKITYSSENSNIVRVSEKEELIAVGIGETVVKGISEDGQIESSCKITVIPVPVDGIEFEESYYQIPILSTVMLNVKFIPENAANKSLSWTSSNSNVVAVTQKGEIIGQSYGTAEVTAVSEDGKHKTTCTVYVGYITEFMNLHFTVGSVSVINGFTYGTLYSTLTNNSPETIKLTNMYVLDGLTNYIIGQTTDPGLLGELAPGTSSLSLGIPLNGVYYPSYMWEFEYKGGLYRVSHRFGASYRSENVEMKEEGKADKIIPVHKE